MIIIQVNFLDTVNTAFSRTLYVSSNTMLQMEQELDCNTSVLASLQNGCQISLEKIVCCKIKNTQSCKKEFFTFAKAYCR